MANFNRQVDMSAIVAAAIKERYRAEYGNSVEILCDTVYALIVSLSPDKPRLQESNYKSVLIRRQMKQAVEATTGAWRKQAPDSRSALS